MKLKDQVVCRELSQKIDELGIKEESLYGWYKHSFIGLKSWWALVPNRDNSLKNISAYTVAELGEMLPNTIKIESRVYMLKMDKFANEFFITYFSDGKAKSFQSYTEANARAKMLIWLKENKLL